MIDKIVVLAAGKGTRMLKLGKEKPKSLINVGHKPFLYYQLNNLKRAGFKEIVLVVGYKKEKMKEFAKHYETEFNLTLVDQFKILGSQKYGTACPIAAVEKVVAQENFAVVNGDDYFSINDLKRLREINDNFCYISAFKMKMSESYGVFKTHGEYLLEITEKPRAGIDFEVNNPPDILTNAGLYKFTPEIFKTVKKVKKSARGEYELTDAINILAKQRKVKLFRVKGCWLTFSRPEDVKKMEEFLLKNNERIN
jgi:NDP-sugar pyrophosphorylase family protein